MKTENLSLGTIFQFTDLGNSERFLRDHSQDIRYSTKIKSWYTWNGSRWVEDLGANEIQSKAKKTVRLIPEEAKIDPSKKKAILKHAATSETFARINAMVNLARSAAEIQIEPDRFDADPWVLNCTNGAVDLRSANLLPHNRDHYMTLVTGAPYLPDAECPRFLQFLGEIMAGNANMVEFLQRIFGYALTGSGCEQVLFFLVGQGSNGKTTLIETLRKVLGKYARHTPTASLIKNNLQIRNDLARLKGARLVTASEIGRAKELDEATTKMLTGEDPVTSRLLYREYFEYRPAFKLFLLANHTPEIRGSDFGIWRRILLVPFPVIFSGDKVDKNLLSKLEQELPGILSWAVQGSLKWRRDGLQIPLEVKVATEDYRKETDIVQQFVADCCDREKNVRVTSKRLYEAYTGWAEENMDEVLTQKAFGTLLKTAGLKAKKSNGLRYWTGLRLKASSSVSSDKKSEDPVPGTEQSLLPNANPLTEPNK